MEKAVTLNLDCKITLRLQSSINNNYKSSILIKTQFPKSTRHRFCCLSSLRQSPPPPTDGCSSKTHTTLLVETYHRHRRLRALIEKLEKDGSCPLQILGDDGDWTKNDFWAAIKFLRHASRSNEILQIWKSSFKDIMIYNDALPHNEAVELNTDPLVLTAFEKGHFLRDCEEVFTSLEPKAGDQKIWTYRHLIDLVTEHKAKQT